MPTLRVAVVTTWFPSEEHPAQAPFNLEHVRAIAGFADVEVLHVRLGGRSAAVHERYQGISVRRFALDPRRPLEAFRTLRAVARATRTADVVHTMAFSTALVVAAARPFARRLPWLHTEHWSGVTNPASVSPLWQRLAWLRRVLRRPRIVTAVTSQLAAAMRPFTRDDVVVVPCVVENPRPLVARPRDGARLVGVGYLVPGKRPLFAVDVVAELVRRGVDARMVWVGGGPLEAETRAHIADAGLTDRFELTGMVAPQEVFAHFDDANLFFLPTERENFFTAAAEAVSAGRPVVVARVGGFVDYLDDRNAVFAEDSVTGYADAIQTALERFAGVPESRIADPVRERFGLRRVGADFEALYSRLG